MAQSHQQEALHIAIETTSQSLIVEKENEELRAQLQKNLALIEQFETVATRTQQLQDQLRQKKAELESKQNELVGVQSALISILKNPPSRSSQSDSLAVIPVVLGKVQKDITGLTDAAIAANTIAIPVLSLFKVSEGFNQLFDTLVTENIISETPEEKQERLQRHFTSQKEILAKLKALAQAAGSRPEPKVVVVDAAAGEAPRGPIPRTPTPEPPPPEPSEESAKEGSEGGEPPE
jgi:hypothetical protein